MVVEGLVDMMELRRVVKPGGGVKSDPSRSFLLNEHSASDGLLTMSMDLLLPLLLTELRLVADGLFSKYLDSLDWRRLWL